MASDATSDYVSTKAGEGQVEVVLSEVEREQLEWWGRWGKSAQSLAQRSRIALAAAEGSEELRDRRASVAGSRDGAQVAVAVRAGRLDGLLDERRPGRPRTVSDAQVEEVIIRTLKSTPKDATHWWTRSMAAEVGFSQTAVSRIWRASGLEPHRLGGDALGVGGQAGAERFEGLGELEIGFGVVQLGVQRVSLGLQPGLALAEVRARPALRPDRSRAGCAASPRSWRCSSPPCRSWSERSADRASARSAAARLSTAFE